MKKTYLSGKIRGLDEKQYTQNFESARIDYLKRYELTEYPISKENYCCVINPCCIKPLFGIKKYWCYMITDIYQLLKCDSIFMLNNWKDSRGARIELSIALLTGKKVIFQ